MEKSLLKVSSFTLLLAGWLCASCQDDQIVDQKVSLDNSNTIQLVEITDNNEVIPVTSTRNNVSSASNLALKFASEADYLAALRDIEERDLAGKLHFADSLGLTSMQKLLQLADDELESIGANAVNESDFRNKYNVYKEKYSKYFVFNQVDKSDLSAYMPDGDERASFLVGIGYKVVVGNRVERIDFYQRMSVEDSLLFANDSSIAAQPFTRALKPEAEWPVNSFNERPFDGKKTVFNFRPTSGREFEIHLGAQKKMWYGWKKDPARDFYLKFGVSNFQYVVAGAGGHPVWTNSPEYIYSFLGAKGKVNMTIGRGLGGNIEGKAYVWTDQTIEKDAKGNVVMELVNKRPYPKGNINNSLPCKLSWANGTY